MRREDAAGKVQAASLRVVLAEGQEGVSVVHRQLSGLCTPVPMGAATKR